MPHKYECQIIQKYFLVLIFPFFLKKLAIQNEMDSNVDLAQTSSNMLLISTSL